MQPDTSSIPHNLAQVLWLLLASSLGWTGAEVRSWLARRKREPVELDKVRAETRQINTATDVSLMQAATDALTNALRLRDERDHWERKAGHWEKEAEGLKRDVEQAERQAKLDNLQMKRLKTSIDVLEGILDDRKIPYPKWDDIHVIPYRKQDEWDHPKE